MGLTSRSRRIACFVIASSTISAWILCATLHVSGSVHADESTPQPNRVIQLGVANPDALYALTFAVKDPIELQGNDSVKVTVNDAQGEVTDRQRLRER